MFGSVGAYLTEMNNHIKDDARDLRQFAPSTARNRDAIGAVLRRVLPEQGYLLEIASGSGEHAVAFAGLFPGLRWQPSDCDRDALASVEAWRVEASLENVQSAVFLDTTDAHWPVERADAMVAINMVHIAPWAACEGLMAGAGRVLRQGGVLYLYGPYTIDGRHTAPSNAQFDNWLKARDPAFGVRDLAEVESCAKANGLMLDECRAMAANNFSLIFRRR
ncbi:uncharacterized protein DUF938 [Varunaivibrio sulfuroxidans]|uniref:Uncharacterized protein DUF938 n=2 Tax=Varunaivibrio sulfuroxidans TaxID=1773489 RepID=A0A4V2UNW9_9PROT|nr:uncharacterized protein DUF938 [Varunaivibrio sulfuroxidans]